MLLSLHDGLLQALASEQHAAAASALLQALQALLRGAPYHRLPEDLLPRTLEVQQGCACCQAVLQAGLQTEASRRFCGERPTTACLGELQSGRLHTGNLPPYRVEGCILAVMGCRQHKGPGALHRRCIMLLSTAAGNRPAACM